jgi:hypothetical protein
VSEERGAAALAAAVVALAVSAALVAAVAEVSRTELILTQHRQAAASALAAADGCLAQVVSGVAPGWDFTALLAGPDGLAGNADDGFLATPTGCTGGVVPAPGVGVTAARVLVTVEASAGGGRRSIEAVLARAPVPGPAALLWLTTLPPSAAIRGSVLLDGVDADPDAPRRPAFAAPADPEALDAWAAAVGGALSTTAGTLPAVAAPAPPLAALVARVLAAPHGGAETLVPAGAPTPTLAYVAGDLPVDAALRGAGLLVVDGLLDIRGGLDFTGVVVASGGVRIASGASLTVAGAIWTGAPFTFEVDGAAALRADAAAVAAADALVPLPRPAVILGQRDLG